MNIRSYKKFILLGIVGILSTLPFLLIKNSEFGGVDALAPQLVYELNPDYVQWIDHLWAPPGSETESLLFSIQAALGGGVIGYILGLLKERARKNAR